MCTDSVAFSGGANSSSCALTPHPSPRSQVPVDDLRKACTMRLPRGGLLYRIANLHSARHPITRLVHRTMMITLWSGGGGGGGGGGGAQSRSHLLLFS